MEQQTILTKKEKKQLQRQERLESKDVVTNKRRMKKIMRWVLGITLIIGGVGSLSWYVATRPPVPESDIVSRNGLHLHPELAIYVKGVKQEIPANLGMGGVEMPIHTHDSTGVIHLEMSGLIRKENITLGQFFKVWGKDIRSFSTNIKMTVNDKENTEFENYVMQDKDKIEVRYE